MSNHVPYEELNNDAYAKVKVGGTYRHFKGTEYLVHTIARDSEDAHRILVIYQEKSLLGTLDHIWARPIDMFVEEVTKDGKTFPRFELIS